MRWTFSAEGDRRYVTVYSPVETRYLIANAPDCFDRLEAVMMDMDGSSTDTEKLVLEAMRLMMAEALLSHQIYKILKQRKLSQREAAETLGIAQPDVNKLMNGKYSGFSIRRLSQILNRLGRDVEIVVKKPRKRGAAGKLTVRAA